MGKFVHWALFIDVNSVVTSGTARLPNSLDFACSRWSVSGLRGEVRERLFLLTSVCVAPQTERLEQGTAWSSLYIPRKLCYINLHNFHYSVTLQSSLSVKWRISVPPIRCGGVFSFYESVKIEVFYFLRLVGIWGILPSLPSSFL